MIDQASELRRLVAVSSERPASRAQTIAVTSGKGGVGKTSIAVNLGLALAQAGRRVALLDADWGLSNTEIMLGISPKRDLRHVLNGECRLEDIVVEAPHGLMLIPGASGVAELANMDSFERDRLMDALSYLHDTVDFILLDTSPGISDAVIDLAMAADQILLLSTAQPTSLTDAYASAKVICGRRSDAPLSLVLNMVASPAQARDVGAGFASVTERFLGRAVPLRGFVSHDPRVADAVVRQTPFVLGQPHSPAAKCVRLLAGELLAQPVVRSEMDRGGLAGFIAKLRPMRRQVS